MSYNRYGDNRNQGQVPSPWAGGFPAGSNDQGNNLSMNLLGSLMNNASSGSGNMANLATSLVAQALQNKPGGMLIGGNHFGGQSSMGGGGSSFNVSGPRGGGYSDRGGNRDDYRRGRDYRDNSSNSSRSRPPFRRSRSRSRDRSHVTSRGSRRDNASSSSRQNRPPSEKRMRAGSPKDRAPFEVYIGNYPVRFRENDVRNLFTEHGVTVSTIRLKHDGHKVFAFAETTSEDEIQKAIKAMDSKEIHGRRLRVRSSKDKDRKDKLAAEEKRKPPPKRELTVDDVSRHLVFSFNGFLDRQAKKDGLEEEKMKKIEQAKDLLKEAFDIPDDDSLKISRNLELIFLHNNRREIPIPPPVDEPKEEETEVKTEETETVENADEEMKNEEGDESEVKEEANDEESELVDKLGDAVENLVEETNDEEEAAEINDESEEKQDATQEEEIEEQEEEDEVVELEDEPEAEPENATSPSTRGGRGRGGGRARRARGRRGGASSA